MGGTQEEDRRQMTDDGKELGTRHFWISNFELRSLDFSIFCDFNDFNDFNDLNGFYDFS